MKHSEDKAQSSTFDVLAEAKKVYAAYEDGAQRSGLSIEQYGGNFKDYQFARAIIAQSAKSPSSLARKELPPVGYQTIKRQSEIIGRYFSGDALFPTDFDLTVIKQVLDWASGDASPAASERIDLERVKTWAYSKDRKPAEAAFTAGAERQVAYMIEDARLGIPSATEGVAPTPVDTKSVASSEQVGSLTQSAGVSSASTAATAMPISFCPACEKEWSAESPSASTDASETTHLLSHGDGMSAGRFHCACVFSRPTDFSEAVLVSACAYHSKMAGDLVSERADHEHSVRAAARALKREMTSSAPSATTRGNDGLAARASARLQEYHRAHDHDRCALAYRFWQEAEREISVHLSSPGNGNTPTTREGSAEASGMPGTEARPDFVPPTTAMPDELPPAVVAEIEKHQHNHGYAFNAPTYRQTLYAMAEFAIQQDRLARSAKPRADLPAWVWGLTQEGIRDEVAQFAALMERKLKVNDHKRHWSQCPLDYLLKRLVEEVRELERATYHPRRTAEMIGGEAADVANFAMMIADTFKALPEISRPVDIRKESDAS